MYVCKLWPGYHRQSWGSVRTAPAPPRSNRRRESWRGSGRARRSSLGGTTSPLTTATRRPSRAVPSRDRVMTFPQFGYVSLSSPTLAKTGLCKLRLLNGVICGLVSILVGGPGGLSVVVTVNPATPDPGPARVKNPPFCRLLMFRMHHTLHNNYFKAMKSGSYLPQAISAAFIFKQKLIFLSVSYLLYT